MEPFVVPTDGVRPKMPHRIKTLYQQIMAHPRCPETSSSFKFAFEAGCVGGGSWCSKENNAWCRSVWKHLYLGEPEPTVGGGIF